MKSEDFPKEGTDKATVDTYNSAAVAYEERYSGMGARIEDVERGFSYSDSPEPSVVEIGCGNARDAEVILSRTGKYIGIDVSSSMIELAQKNLPEAEFVVADVVNYEFPKGIDIVFAFASFLHLDREKLKDVFKKIEVSLNENGVLYLSLKRRDEYSSEVVSDEYGSRRFYYYSKTDILELKPTTLREVYYDEQSHGGDEWLTLVLQKI